MRHRISLLCLTLACLILTAVPSQAAWARHAGATLAANVGNPGASHNFGNLGATPNANEKLIALSWVAEITIGGQPTTSGITSSSGTWTKCETYQHLWIADGFYGEMSIWASIATGAAVNTITAAYTNAATNAGAMLAVGTYSGLSTTACDVDLQLSANGENVATPADSGTTGGTTTQANELKTGFYADSGYNDVISAGTLDTTYSVFIKDDSNVNSQGVLEDADSGASGSTARATVTWASGGQDWIMAVVTWKLAAGGVTCTPTLSILGVGRCG